ncbi:hypothetical protein MIND_00046800 [Mycena indigotica]|uniref:THO1-MOS11 C-terminal domain-containing protein n=1 Tax=Mycena indigotica TaxID=2126181 RepID=A0A8H6TEK0_9AGAR|nr:uncharacterized protein MIND_00046800 [Mycena indigotica]KAF7315322.1 hypothetical protein MIND_00046800 [Mycena indigotica]
MEAKLKSLKVADLRELLKGQTLPTKITKNDLITRIMASKEAQEAFNAKYAPKDDLLAPPEDLDWDADQVAAEPEVVAVTEPETPAPTPPEPAPKTTVEPIATETVVSPPSTTEKAEDPELAKRKQRAERFGIPLVEPRKPVEKQPKKTTPTKAANGNLKETEEKLNSRAARFGTGKKRPAPAVEEVDAEEQERRQKRAERFGIKP